MGSSSYSAVFDQMNDSLDLRETANALGSAVYAAPVSEDLIRKGAHVLFHLRDLEMLDTLLQRYPDATIVDQPLDWCHSCCMFRSRHASPQHAAYRVWHDSHDMKLRRVFGGNKTCKTTAFCSHQHSNGNDRGLALCRNTAKCRESEHAGSSYRQHWLNFDNLRHDFDPPR